MQCQRLFHIFSGGRLPHPAESLIASAAHAIGSMNSHLQGCHAPSLVRVFFESLLKIERHDEHTWMGPIGSSGNAYGKLWLNPQSWAVMANIGTRKQQEGAMDAVAEQLDTGIGLKLLTPGFGTWPDVDDPLSGYGPGTGENGAIFCHANAWVVIAEAELGRGDQAWRYFTQILPENVTQKVGLDRYSAEPFAWAGNIAGPENPRFG